MDEAMLDATGLRGEIEDGVLNRPASGTLTAMERLPDIAE